MPAVRVGEPLDSVEEREPGAAAGGEAMTSQQFNCERVFSMLGGRIVEAIKVNLIVGCSVPSVLTH